MCDKPKLGKKGVLVDDRFLLDEYIDSGGQGEVWRALDTVNDNVDVAVKLFQKDTDKRVKDEVKALTEIIDANVIRFISSDTTTDVGGAYHYLAMEFAKHNTLREFDYFKGDIELSINLFYKICSGVKAIHAIDYLHRDLKPSNILVCENQRDLKVGDFGLCLPPVDPDREDTPGRENVYLFLRADPPLDDNGNL
jgi:serine/threonine-protein kinase